MNQTLVAASAAQFYSILEAAVKDPKLGGPLAAHLFGFYNRPEIKTRWMTAPASTAIRFHHAFDGGLLHHTLEVFRFAQMTADALGQQTVLNAQFGWLFTKTAAGFVPYIDLLATVCLHDLSKIGDTFGIPRFGPNMIKNGTVRSDKIPYETNEKLGKFTVLANPQATPAQLQALYLAQEAMEWVPDGVQSLSIVRAVDPALYGMLNEGIRYAIIHHDGAYGKGRRLLTGNETPLQMIMHFADMWSSRMNKEEYRG